MPSERFFSFWHNLSLTPLLGLLLTLFAYRASLWLYEKSGKRDVFHPTILSILIIMLFLWGFGWSYEAYFESAKIVHFLLGPATVALAIPLFAAIDKLKKMALPLLVALFVGSGVTVASALFLAKALGASKESILSIATKSITTPIAMGVTEKLGGIPSLAAVIVLLTGAFGVLLYSVFFRFFKEKDHAIQGFTTGLTAHGLGTARAFQHSPESGAFAALAMGMNAVLTAFALPVLLPLFL